MDVLAQTGPKLVGIGAAGIAKKSAALQYQSH